MILVTNREIIIYIFAELQLLLARQNTIIQPLAFNLYQINYYQLRQGQPFNLSFKLLDKHTLQKKCFSPVSKKNVVEKRTVKSQLYLYIQKILKVICVNPYNFSQCRGIFPVHFFHSIFLYVLKLMSIFLGGENLEN